MKKANIMSEEDIPKDTDLEKSKDSLEHVETKEIHSKRKVVLKCAKCDVEQDFPVCEECGEQMTLEGDKLVCCDKEIPVPTHHEEAMVPKII